MLLAVAGGGGGGGAGGGDVKKYMIFFFTLLAEWHDSYPRGGLIWSDRNCPGVPLQGPSGCNARQ